MEGFSNRQSGTFVKVVNGQFAIPQREASDKTKTRETKTGKTVHELVFDTYEGLINDVVLQDKDKDGKPLEFGPQLKIHFLSKNNGEKSILDVPFKSVFAKRFLLSFPNFDLSKSLVISVRPDSFKNERNQIIETTSVFFSQEGEEDGKVKLIPISQKWKKDNWEGITEPKLVDDGEGGKKRSYYYTMVDALKICHEILSAIKPAEPEPVEAEEIEDDHDPLPF